MTGAKRVGLVVWAIVLLLWWPGRSFGESYVAGQIGGVFPQDLGTPDVSGAGVPRGTTLSSLSLNNSFLYGAKAGYYFDAQGLPWLGVETEVYNANPNIPQQTTTINFPGVGSVTGSFTGLTQRVLTWAPIIVQARYPGERLQPYAGVGLGVFFAHACRADCSSDTAPGFIAKAGLRYFVTTHIAVFGEWKYNHASFSYGNGSSGPFGPLTVSSDYNANVLAFGVGYHF